jgi:exodeoxyribonuclease VII large subunit
MSLKRDLVLKKRTLEALSARLKSPKDRLREQIQRLDEIELGLRRAIQLLVERKKMALERLAGKLHALSPLQVLSRGYALVQRKEGDGVGAVVRSSASLQKGDSLVLRFSDGSVGVVTE